MDEVKEVVHEENTNKFTIFFNDDGKTDYEAENPNVAGVFCLVSSGERRLGERTVSVGATGEITAKITFILSLLEKEKQNTPRTGSRTRGSVGDFNA